MPHLSVIREGLTSAFLTAATDLLPVSKLSDFGLILVGNAEWIALGGITVASDNPVLGNAIQIVRPKANGGTLELAKEIRLGPISRVITLTAVEYNNFTTQLAAMTTHIDETGVAIDGLKAYTPFSGDTAPIRGWFQIVWYDQDDVLTRREILWGELRLGQALTSGMGGAISPQFVLNIFPADNSYGWFLCSADDV